MRRQVNRRWSTLPLIAALVTIALLLCSHNATFAQNADANRRLCVAVVGFELEETAAKDALAGGADINWKNDAMNGETLLITAIKGFKEAKVVKFLLDNGADPNLKDDSGRTALSWAQQYKIDRDQNGREIIKLLQQATGKNQTATTKKTTTKKTATATKRAAVKNTVPAKTVSARRRTTATAAKPRRTTGPPTVQEVKATIEKSFTTIYQNHFYGVQNKVTFAWSGAIVVGSPQRRLQPARTCYPVKLQVKVTAIDPRDGNTSTVARGMNANIGGYRKNEIFCFFRNGFGEWEYGIYEQ